MKPLSIMIVGLLLATGLTMGTLGRTKPPSVLKAHADISGVPGSGISGVVTFTQAP